MDSAQDTSEPLGQGVRNIPAPPDPFEKAESTDPLGPNLPPVELVSNVVAATPALEPPALPSNVLPSSLDNASPPASIGRVEDKVGLPIPARETVDSKSESLVGEPALEPALPNRNESRDGSVVANASELNASPESPSLPISSSLSSSSSSSLPQPSLLAPSESSTGEVKLNLDFLSKKKPRRNGFFFLWGLGIFLLLGLIIWYLLTFIFNFNLNKNGGGGPVLELNQPSGESLNPGIESSPSPEVQKEVSKILPDKAFGALASADLELYLLKGLSLRGVILNYEATDSLETKLYVYDYRVLEGEATPSARIYESTESAFLEKTGTSRKSLYELKSSSQAFKDLVSGEKVYGVTQPIVDFGKIKIVSMTVGSSRLVYGLTQNAGQIFLTPVYVFEGTAKIPGEGNKGTNEIKIWLYAFGLGSD